jgi:iron-sulfur cluster assembly protein
MMSSRLVSLSRPDSREGTPPQPDPRARSADAEADAGDERQPIRITESAAQEILRLAMKRGTPHAAIRVGLRGGGCTGYTYLFDFEDGDPRPRDTVIEAHGVRVLVDPKSLKLLRGMELDFTRKLMGHGFHFNNPNAKGSCGCGAAVQF